MLFDGEVERKAPMERPSPATAETTWSRSPACPVFPLCQSAYFPPAPSVHSGGLAKYVHPVTGDLNPLVPCSSSVLGISLEGSNSKEAFTPKALKVILFYRLYLEWKPCLLFKKFCFQLEETCFTKRCVGFCHTVRIRLYIYPLPLELPSRPSHLGDHSARPGSLCDSATPHQLSVLHMVVCIRGRYFLHSSHYFLLPL